MTQVVPGNAGTLAAEATGNHAESEKDSEEIRAVCPHCGSAHIQECNVAYANLDVLEWDEEDGEPVPAAFGEGETEWETDTSGDPYICGKCSKTFSQPVRV